jgi:hypothetical protein
VVGLKSPSHVKNESNLFKFEFQTHSNFDWSKSDFPELQKFEIKCDFEDYEMMNKYLHKTSLDSEGILNENSEDF